MKCTENSCTGEIDLEQNVQVRTGCMSSTIVHPCGVCGRLHWKEGSGVQNRAGHKAFFKNGYLVNVDENGKETIL